MARKHSDASLCTLMATERVRVYPDWSNLYSNVLGKIFNLLHVVEKQCFASVCRSWRTLAKEEINSFLRSSTPKSLLFFPTGQGHVGKSSCNFLSLEGKESTPLKMPLESHVVGSCRGGWLLFMKHRTNLVLWNPLYDVKIHLPSLYTLPGVKRDLKVSENFICKAAIFGSDPISRSNCRVLVIYEVGKLAFVKYGDSQWSDLPGAANQHFYVDVTCCGDSILALSDEAELEVWNLSTSIPRKTMEIRLPFPQDMVESQETFWDTYKPQLYMVESQESILLVVRWIANFVYPNGVLLTEHDFLENQLLIVPYETKKFYVYKLDSEAKKWVQLQSLGNQALFLGGNQSVSLSVEDYIGCDKNSIYFTDDNWDQVDEHEWFGGHDMGIFSLEDGSIRDISDRDEKLSPPFWVVS